MTHCLLSLGSNLASPKRQLTLAIKSLKYLPKSHVLLVAPYLRNSAWGKKCLPDYYNTVALLKTALNPFALLKQCQQIENRQRRVRRVKYGARTLDIDVLSIKGYKMRHPKLTLPHPQMDKRLFVQVPLRWIVDRHCDPRLRLGSQ